jgi:uncharacterized protein
MLNKLNLHNFKDKPVFINESSINYLVLVGSHSYGAETKDSDYDFYGFTVPPVEYVFPHTIGHIDGFGKRPQGFEQWEKLHAQTELGETDIAVYNIVKHFKLLMDCNPNMIHTLFVPDNCVVKEDRIGALVRENRLMFLSTKAYYTFRGMAFSHLKKLQNRKTQPEGKRAKLIEEYGYDTKDASYCIRLIKELEEIMIYGTLTLDKNSDLITKIRQGYYTLPELMLMYNHINYKLEKLWESKSSYLNIYGEPNEKMIKNLLIDCLRLKGYPLMSIGFYWHLTN